MNRFHLAFSNRQMEKDYNSLTNQSRLETFMVTVILWLFYLVSFAASSELHVEIIVGFGFLGLIVAVSVVLQWIGKLKKYCGYVGALLTLGLATSVLYSIVTNLSQANKLVTFLRGWSFACVEILLVNQFSRFPVKVVVALISFGLRFGCIGQEDPEIFKGDILLRNILFEVLLIYIFYNFERKERDLFRKFYDVDKELGEIKRLLSQNIQNKQSFVVIDNRQKILFCNKTFTKLAHLVGDQVKSTTLFVVGDQMMIDRDSLKFANPTTIPVTVTEERLTLNDFIQDLVKNKFYDCTSWFISGSCEIEGDVRNFEITITSMVWEKIPSVVITLDDVTYKKELENLRLADENKDLLIATVSHELRTPLHGILGLIQVVESKTNEKNTLEHLSLCKDNANLLLNLVNSLLDLQQIQHGEVKLNPSQVHLHTMVHSITRLFAFLASEKNVELCVIVDESVPQYIITDEGRLKQVVINLVSNALKFTFSGNITISVTEDLENPNHIKISVLDTGIGIKKENQSKLFQLYTKIDDKEGMNKHGVGLGLTICNSIVKLLSDTKTTNRIVVSSEYGLGSSFSFSIHKDLTTILFLNEKNYKQRPLTMHTSATNITDFEEFNKPMNIKARLSFYSSLKNPSLKGLSVSKLSTYYGKKDFATTEEELTGFSPQAQAQERESNKYNITSINLMKFGKSEAQLENLTRGLILVVDDNSFNLLIAKTFLETEGFQVQTALNGQEAIEKVGSIEKELICILMDCQMPIMDGYEATRVLKRMMKGGEIKEVPIIALTASNDDVAVRKCFECGMDEYLCKPLVKETLIKLLGKLIVSDVEGEGKAEIATS